jgi:hypothetical protein
MILDNYFNITHFLYRSQIEREMHVHSSIGLSFDCIRLPARNRGSVTCIIHAIYELNAPTRLTTATPGVDTEKMPQSQGAVASPKQEDLRGLLLNVAL